MTTERKAVEPPHRRRIAVALLFSLIAPGSGLIYAGRFRAGTAVFFAMVIGLPAAAGISIRLNADPFLTLVSFTAAALFAMLFQSVWSVIAAIRVRDTYEKKPFNHIAVYVGFVVLNAVSPAALVVKATCLETFSMSSHSMSPTLLAGDYIAAVKGQEISVGDAVVFRRPPTEQLQDPNTPFVYRVVALGGDTVEMRADRLYRNGVRLDITPLGQAEMDTWNALTGTLESNRYDAFEEINEGAAYHVLQTPDMEDSFGPVSVPPAHFFVLGDNRDNANDSRFWGAVPAENLIGIAKTIWLSIAPDGSGFRWDRIGTDL